MDSCAHWGSVYDRTETVLVKTCPTCGGVWERPYTEREKGPKCDALTLKGERCRHQAEVGLTTCKQHDKSLVFA